MRPANSDWKIIDEWSAGAPELHRYLLYRAMFAISDGSWANRYRHWDDDDLRAIVLEIETGDVLVWRPITEYPDWYRVFYVGRP